MRLQDAVKRWVKYSVSDGSKVGLVTFSDEEPASSPVIYELGTVEGSSREEMIGAVDRIQFGGTTCIGCGLDWALNLKGALKGSYGGVIILITDGLQQCSSSHCLTISDMIPEVLSRQVTVVTVALGLDADPDLEKLSVLSGGKSFYVDDSSGPTAWDDAFTGSLTYQPGDVISNKTVTVLQLDYPDMSASDVRKGYYDMDVSIGRETVLTIQVTVRENDCREPLSIWLVSPDLQETLNTTFTCSKSNFGVFRYSSPDLGMEGRWVYRLTALEDLDVSIKVESKSRSTSDDPIVTKCWIAAGAQEIDTSVNVKLAVVGEVKQGPRPVVGAKVRAVVERPPDSSGTIFPDLELELLDNGSGADKIKNDGVYSKYFSHYTGKGRYGVKCKVEGDQDTGVNGGFLGIRSASPASPGTPLCCGSDALSPSANVTRTGNFSRQAAGGGFRVTNEVDLNEDSVPPGQVMDLVLEEITDQTVRLQFTAPGDDIDSRDLAAEYVFKYSSTVGNLTGDNFDSEEFNERITEEDLIDSSLDPVTGGEIKTIFLKSSIFEANKKYVLAMRSRDESDNWSSVSNKVTIFLPSAPTSTTKDQSTSTSPGGGCSDSLLFSSGSHYPGSVLTCYSQDGQKVSLAEDTVIEPGNSCIFMTGGHLEEGLVMEFFCRDSVWSVKIINSE